MTHVVSGLGNGGTELTCLRLAKHWQGSFDQNIVAWSPASRSLEPAFRNLSGCALSIGPESFRSHLERWMWISERVRNEAACDAMIIHCFGVEHLLAAAAARAVGVEGVVAKAGNPPPTDKAARRRWRAVLLASRVLGCPIFSCSHAVDDELRKLNAGMPKGSGALPNGIDVLDFALVAHRARLMRPPMGPVIGMVARLDPIKDHATLIRAFALVQHKVPKAELWIVGDGSLRAPLEAMAEESGVAAATRFFGDRTDVANLLGQMDFYAFSTTRDEGFGIALIEAMAAGVPIVATDVPACREVLADGDAGVLVPPADPSAMASSLLALLQNESECRQMIARADRRVRAEYSLNTNAQRWASKLFRDDVSMQVAQCAS